MPSQRQLFQQYLAQTSARPMGLEIVKAEGNYLYDQAGKKYLDLISGISVSNIGHLNPQVVSAMKEQLDQFSYLMVYGEYVQAPQVKYATLLANHLPDKLSCTYFVNSGSEAVEGALKLARKHTGRTEIIAFHGAYHGSSMGALSVMGDDRLKKPFEPLIPGVRFLNFNNEDELDQITEQTAAVIIEPIQGEAGIRVPSPGYLQRLSERCNESGTLLMFDEIQTGFGRTGTLFAFEQYHVVPDVLLLAKALGGGMPLGAFISSREIMKSLNENPELGHITTFGGHPLSCVAGYEALNFLSNSGLLQQVDDKARLFQQHLNKYELRQKGLMMALELGTHEKVQQLMSVCLSQGVVVDWFLFCNTSLRIAPPLTIMEDEIEFSCKIINEGLKKLR